MTQGNQLAIKHTKSIASIPSDKLDDWGPLELPISETVSQLRGLIINEHSDGSEAGIGSVHLGPLTWGWDQTGDGC